MAGGVGHVALHNIHNNEIIALATKLGTGSSTPTSGKVLRATGTGTSAWQQVDLSIDVTGSLPMANLTGTLPLTNGGTGATTATSARTNLSVYSTTEVDTAIATAVANAKAALHPVGSIYISVTSTNPGTSLGFGTWVAFGTGRTLVGIDTGQTEFNTIEKTGGAKTHTLTISEMPNHNHTTLSVGYVGSGGDASNQFLNPSSEWDHDRPTGFTGGGQAHNNLQPYIVVYMWKRTA